MRVPASLAVLHHHRRFRLLVAGQVTSNVGDACYAVALPWFVLSGHGGTVLLGTVLAAYGIPRTALILAGGWASDRFRPQTVMLVTDAVRVLAMAALAAAAAAGPPRAVLLIPLAVVLGAGEGLFLPASYSVVPSLLPARDLQAGNALASGGTQLASLAGPAVGGALVALGSSSAAFGLDAASFAVSALTLLAMRPARTPSPADTPADAPSPGDETGPSVRTLLRTQRVLWIIIAVNIAANLGSAGLDGVALPGLAHGPLHADAPGYGAILAGFAAGALLGTLAAGQVSQPRRPVVIASLAFIMEAAAAAAAPYLGSVAAVVAVMAVLGLGNGFGNTYTVTAFQRWAPPGTLGRLNGILLLTSFGLAPVSVLLAAWFGQALGPAAFFLFFAVTLAVSVGGGLTQRVWRNFGTTGGSAVTVTAEPEAAAVPAGPPSAGERLPAVRQPAAG